MSRIDLSRYSFDQRSNNPTRQVFEGEGRNSAYRALADFGGTLASVATDFHHKEQEVMSEIESTRASTKLKEEVAQQRLYALNNRDQDNPNFVLGTNQTYDEYIAGFVDRRNREIGGDLKAPMTKLKYGNKSGQFIENTKIDSLFEQVKIATEITNRETDRYMSTGSNNILYAEQATIASLNTSLSAAQVELYPMINQVKGVGTTNTMAQQRRVEKAYGESAFESVLRRMQTSDRPSEAGGEFSDLMGLRLKFADVGTAKKFVIEKYKEYNDGQIPDEGTVDETIQMLLGEFPEDSIKTEEHEVMKHFTPAEKDRYLDRALAISFKKKETNANDFKLRIESAISSPLTKDYQSGVKFPDPRQFQEEFSRILEQAPLSVTPRQKLEYIQRAVVNQVEGEVIHNMFSRGTTAYITSGEEYKRKFDQYFMAVADRVVGKDYVDSELTEYQTFGDKGKVRLESSLRAKADEFNYNKINNPESFIAKDPEYVRLTSNAFRFGSNGEVIVNKGSLSQAVKQRKMLLGRVGSMGAKIEGQDILPRTVTNRLLTQVQTLSPNQQREFYEQINDVDPNIAATMYSTLVREKKMDLLDASIAMQSSFGNSEVAKYQQDRITSFRNQYTGKYEKELLQRFQSEGWLGKDVDISHLDQEIAKASSKSETLNKYMEIARASGMSSESIKNMFNVSNLQLITKDYMNRTSPASIDASTALFSTFSGRVNKAFEGAMGDYFQAKAMPISTNGLKAVVDPSRYSDPEQLTKATKTAEELTSKMYDNLESGNLRLDLSNIAKTSLGKRYANADGSFMQKQFLRDLKRDKAISFNTTDISGKATELVAMIQDKSGNYYRIKLLDSRGGSVVPYLNGIEELQTKTADDIYNDNFSPLTAPAIIAPPKKVTPKKVTPKKKGK